MGSDERRDRFDLIGEDNVSPVFHFAVSGRSERGKTSLITALVEKLDEDGYRVATIKHTLGEFGLDEEGKDTWRHGQAGAELVVFSTPKETTYIFHEEKEIGSILEQIESMNGYDIVLIEGMKGSNIPKIEVKEPSTVDKIKVDIDELYREIEKGIQLSNILKELPGLDCGDCGFEDCLALAQEIFKGEKTLEDCEVLTSPGEVEVKVNGEKIPLGKFPNDMIKGSITGLLKSLKGVEGIREASIKFETEGE